MHGNRGHGEKQKAVRILAKSLYRELTAQGYDDKQIVALATELISAVTNRIASHQVAEATDELRAAAGR